MTSWLSSPSPFNLFYSSLFTICPPTSNRSTQGNKNTLTLALFLCNMLNLTRNATLQTCLKCSDPWRSGWWWHPSPLPQSVKVWGNVSNRELSVKLFTNAHRGSLALHSLFFFLPFKCLASHAAQPGTLHTLSPQTVKWRSVVATNSITELITLSHQCLSASFNVTKSPLLNLASITEITEDFHHEFTELLHTCSILKTSPPFWVT